MVSQPALSVSYCWRTISTFALVACTIAATSGAVHAQAAGRSAGALPFGISSFFGTSDSARKTDLRTRITIDLHRKSNFEIFSLSNPNRVIIELPQVGMRLPRLPRSRSKTLVKGLRAGRHTPGRSRIVIDVSEPVVVEKSLVSAKKNSRGAQLELVLVPFRTVSRRTREALKRRPSYGLGGPLAQPPVPRRARGRRW